MSVLLTIFTVVLGLIAALFVYEAFLSARELYRDDGRLRLKEVARARRLALHPPQTEAATHADALAVRRCLVCQRKKRCDELAAARDWDALRAICPNTPYLDSLRAG